jgi:hypothetical protein
MKHIVLTLRLDLTPEASNGAGWYVQGAVDGNQVIQPLYIEATAALKLANEFQISLQTTDGELPSVSPVQLAQSGNGLINEALTEQLRYAEDQASRISNLRRRLGQVNT